MNKSVGLFDTSTILNEQKKREEIAEPMNFMEKIPIP